ncbi:MAG: type II toxin-antitoxin system HicB family antitoxin [Rhodospirillales bacterium]|nr:type II toxin-antitoxin system HicB family antitoxin [Rhodospirillales bacterium]
MSWLDGDEDKAFRGIRRLVRRVVSDLKAGNEAVPEPLSERRFSGKLQVRLPPDLHRRLTVEAAESGVSLNRLISYKLAG